MDDAQYLDPRIVALYDVLNPPDATSDFFVRLVGSRPLRVLDVGCGTGQLALELARAGHRVTASDVAAPMLAIGRTNDRAGHVEWRLGDARSLKLGPRFDAVVMTGHVFQIFLTDTDIADVLARAHAHVAPGGFFAFDTRNPAARGWEKWPARTVTTPDGPVTVRYEVRAVSGDRVHFSTHHAFAGETITTESTLRFLGADQLRERLAGFARVELFGDFDGSAFTPASPEIIVRATA